ncbi:uncharacterized protein LOC124436113 [Xenia sp. Carnegie-2017]|uniref:uncharacterized protein LOC124436113 n=1 Tax=Xenia sp. Carnegie-2017 TaxID=2897299 RepID=UPI001F0447D1|nr:uncharacterized protein LOC124436113 [Xenia sp. Carnegie-2017]
MGMTLKGFSFLKTSQCVDKLFASVMLLCAIVLMRLFLDDAGCALNSWAGTGSLDFGMFAMVTSLVVAMVMLVFFLIALHEQITIINWPLVIGVHQHDDMDCDVAYRRLSHV